MTEKSESYLGYSAKKVLIPREMDSALSNGFVDLEHKRLVADAVTFAGEILAGEKIQAGVFFVHGRQVLGLNQLQRIVVDGTSILKIQPRLPAGNGEERVVLRIFGEEGFDSA